MAGNTNKYPLRSISLPSRSHPTSLRVEEELGKLKASAAESTTSGSICIGLSGLQDLYIGVNDLLNLSSTQEVILFELRNEKWLDELLDGSVRLLDLCEITRDGLLQFKEQIQALQSAFRRRKGDSSAESSIENYSYLRKKMNKDGKKYTAALKQMETRTDQSSNVEDKDCHLIQLLKEVMSVNSLTFQSVLSFLSPSKPKRRSRWLMISKLIMHKGAVACEEESVNEIESADAVLMSERFGLEKIQTAQERLKELEMSIEEIEKCLEVLFRHLIRTRASLLNLISQLIFL